MSKEIWLGPVLATNRASLLARCAEYVATGETDRLLYIAASHPLLDLATQTVLDGKNAHGVWGEFPFYLFRGFVRRVLSGAVVSEARPSGRATNDSEPLMGTPREMLARGPRHTRGLLTPLAPRVPIDREELPLRHSLVSQIIKQLADADQLPAIKRLANRDGCVNTIATLIGELQRAGKTPEEFASIVKSRAADDGVQSPTSKVQGSSSQFDFDRDVSLIYSSYSNALARFGLTDADADQLSALHILRGDVPQVANLRPENDAQVDNLRPNERTQVNNLRHTLPWLDNIDLLVLDGFFDFTPVQGEMLRLLIQRIPNVIVNINYDDRNPQIFQTFQSTIEQLKSIADFEVLSAGENVEIRSGLAPLRERLFNAEYDRGSSPAVREGVAAGRMPAARTQDACDPTALQLLECGDRETELRSIAKEMKRLVGEENYKLADMALVVRERAAYADLILRVFAAESVPCNLERRVAANDIPCIRATAKLLQILRDPEREHVTNPKASDLAHLIKTDYFRLSDEQLLELTKVFDERYATLLDAADQDERNASRRFGLGIGRWAPDVIENVIAYVGSEQRVRAWLDRAARLIRVLPSREAARSFIGATDPNGEDAAVTLEVEAPAPDEPAPKEKTKRPSPIHPAAIAWTMLVIEQLRKTIAQTPEQGTTDELRRALMSLLDAFEFAAEVQVPLTRLRSPADVPQVMLNVRGMEALRRALAATVRSFDVANAVVSAGVSEARPSGRATLGSEPLLTAGLLTQVSLSAFIDELERCLKSQTLSISTGDRDGLRVLEATDVRGLRFRAMFIAGMNEGSFPLRASRDWLYPHEERERLKKHGLVLEDISTETLLKEEHYFYQCACRATERLYLTRPLAADDGIETVPSYYIEELRRAIAPAELERKQIRSDIDSHDVQSISSGAELAAKLVRQKAGHGQHTGTDPGFSPVVATELVSRARQEMYLSDSLLRRVAIEMQRSGDAFGPYDGQITNSDLRALLASHFGPEYVYSASGLSAYGNCAFKFFSGRVLRLEPRNEAALDLPAIDAGKLLHDVLRRFFERHRKQYLPSLDREALRAEINAVADEVFKEHERLVPPLNERIWKIDCEIRKLILEQVLLHELRLQQRTQPRGMLPTYFELAFGRASQVSDPSSKSDYLKIHRHSDASSEAASIQGQIDRVDVSESGQSIVAYDYKLSQGARIEDMSAGRHLQIPIYLAALEQLFVPGFELAGGGYYRLRGRGKRLNQGLYRRMFSDCTDVTGRVMVDDVQWQRVRNEVSRRVWQFIDGMRAGDFRVRPSEGKKTCKFCDHSAVCRYDTYRINRKKN